MGGNRPSSTTRPKRSRRRPFDAGPEELFDFGRRSRVRFDVVKAGLDQRVINLSTLFGNDRARSSRHTSCNWSSTANRRSKNLGTT